MLLAPIPVGVPGDYNLAEYIIELCLPGQRFSFLSV